jgi:hypothetical protein
LEEVEALKRKALTLVEELRSVFVEIGKHLESPSVGPGELS